MFERLLNKIEMLSPIAMLKKGYALVEDKDGKTVKTVGGINKGDNINVILANGNISANVTDISKREW